MSDKIKVYVWPPAGRKFYYGQWVDPLTGKQVTRSTKKITKRDAERWAASKEEELNGKRGPDRKTTWKAIRDEYEAQVYPGQRERTRAKTETTLDAFEVIVDPKWVAELTSADILRFQREIRSRGVSEWTVKGHLAELRKVLRWARENGLIESVPDFKMPKTTERKGRAPTGEEFDRMLAVTPSVVGEKAAPSWLFLLEGLWWSGLRLSEAVALTWDGSDLSGMWIDMDAKPHPMFHIAASFDKANQDRTFPVAKEFYEFLARVPKSKRKGHVFNPMPWGKNRKAGRPPMDRIGKTIATIGEDAAVKVSERKLSKARIVEVREGEPGKRTWSRKSVTVLTKFASAHDLRRAFCVRWALRVEAIDLMEMARHESLTTTQKFYIGRSAAAAARKAWAAAGDAKTEVHGSDARVTEQSTEQLVDSKVSKRAKTQ